MSVLCSDESDLPKQMTFNRGEKKSSKFYGAWRHNELHKVRAEQSQQFNSKILAWPGAEGDREEGNEDE